MHPLVEWRHRNQRTQRQLAELLGCSQTHVSEIESGEKYPARDLLLRISELTGISTDDLLRWERLPAGGEAA